MDDAVDGQRCSTGTSDQFSLGELLFALFFFARCSFRLSVAPLASLIFTFCGRLIENSIFLVLLIIKVNSLSLI